MILKDDSETFAATKASAPNGLGVSISGSVMSQDTTRWRRRPEWNGSEAPRLLFDSLIGDLKTQGGFLGDAMVYRGINLPRLFEGEWITIVWPRWFQELALLDDLAASRTGSVVLSGEADDIRRRAAQCVMARHPGMTIDFQSSLPVMRRWCDQIRHGRLSRPLCLVKAFSRSLWRCITVRGGKEADLAFFPWSAKIAPAIFPVAEAAVGNRRLRACIAGWEVSAPFRLENSWKWDTPASVWSPRILMEAWRATAELQDQWHGALSDGRFNPLGKWNGWDLRPLVIPFFQTIVNHFYTVIADILMMEEWSKRRHIRGIVVPQDGGESVRSLIAGASLAGVRSFSVQYGYPTDTPELSEPFEDLALLNGEFTKRLFLQRGASPEKLAVVGSTAYDRVIRLRSDRTTLRLNLANRYALDPDRSWLVVATWCVQAVYSEETKAAEMALVMEAVSKLPNLQVLFKLHPSDQQGGRVETAAAERFGVDSRVIDDIAENETLLCAADVVVCNYTTLAIMAIVAKTPVVIVDVVGILKSPQRAYVDEGVAEYANTPNSAETALRSILDTGREIYWEQRRGSLYHFITERLHSDDAQAAARMLQIIELRLSGDCP